MTDLPSAHEEHVVYEFFLWSVLAKGAISLAEVISGVAALFIPPAVIVNAAAFVLNYLPQAGLQNVLMQEVAKYTGGAVVFVSIYLLSRGLVKIFLIWSLLKNRLWAYPASLIILGLFLLYQLYQIGTEHSFIVTAITLFDIVVMYFIYREWRIVVRHSAIQ